LLLPHELVLDRLLWPRFLWLHRSTPRTGLLN
jgi:hypothetical protein